LGAARTRDGGKIKMTKCFILMPFREPFNEYYREILRPALSDIGLEVNRADDIYGIEPIMSDILSGIIDADIILADVSAKNPNVNYELGIAHALRKKVIIISQDIEDIPFDYRHLRTIIYDRHRTKWAEELSNRIRKTAANVLAKKDVDYHFDALDIMYRNVAYDSFHGLKNIFITRQKMNAELDALWGSSSSRLDIIAFGLKSFRDSQTLKVIDKLHAGLSIRILTLDPLSDFVKQREIEERLTKGSIRKTIEDLAQWTTKLNDECSRSDAIRLRYYNALPLQFYWRQDDDVFVGPYLYGIGSQQTISYQYGLASAIGKFYERYFESIWNDPQFTQEVRCQ
jgi:hypothetical protein